jgi:(p)ppGpp synthase/HD superfamily hydrolase
MNMNMKNTEAAHWMAVGAHGTQLYGGEPYVDAHLREVVGILNTFGFTGEWEIAGWLHDAVEDTAMTIDIVRRFFGDHVAALVWAVSGFGENRKARIADMHRKVREYPFAAILKTADRIHNMESARALPDQGLFKMYMREWPAFLDLVTETGAVPPAMLERLNRAAS